MTLQVYKVLERLLNASACGVAQTGNCEQCIMISVLFVYEEFNMFRSTKLILSHPASRMAPASHYATIAKSLHEVTI